MYIVADIGGTKTRIARSRHLDMFDDPVIISTPAAYDEALEGIANVVSKLTGSEAVEGIVCGLPVRLSADRRTIESARNLPLWSGHAFADDIERLCGGTVVLENDVALVGLGEAHYGAGIHARVMMYMTVSTGVNAIRIVDGQFDSTYAGYSLGRQYVPSKTPELDLEHLISGKTIQKNYGVGPRELGKDSPVWLELGKTLAYAVHNAILYWAPDRVVLGGSMFNDIGISINEVEHFVQELWQSNAPLPKIMHSSLGDLGGLWGGLARLRQLQ